MNSKKRIMIAAGGTGGHIMPAISLKESLLDVYDIIYVSGNREIEKHIYSENEISPIMLDIKNINLISIFPLIKSIFKVLFIMLKNDIHSVFMMGSYITLPVGIGSVILSKPLFLMEQDSIAGKNIKLFSLFAFKVFSAFKIKLKGIPSRKIIYSGHIINKNAAIKQNSIQKFFSNNNKIILVCGGSQGAIYMFKKIIDIFSSIENFNVILIAGKYYDELKKNETANIKILPFRKDMGYLYSISDIIISRAGAVSLSEIIHTKKPCIFIPFPNATNNHQFFNIQSALKDNPQMRYISEEKLNRERVLSLIEKIKNVNIKPSSNDDALKIIKRTLINYV